MTHPTKRFSLTWTFFLLFLVTVQFQESDAVLNLKLKKLLKKALLLKALAGKKIAIIPIPIPLNLIKEKIEEIKMSKMPPEPMPMPMPPSPMYMPAGYEMMMPKEKEMPPPEMMGSMHYGRLVGV